MGHYPKYHLVAKLSRLGKRINREVCRDKGQQGLVPLTSNGGAPPEIGRIDSPSLKQPNSQWHVHPSDNKKGGTNFDGTPHDGGYKWGRKAKEFLKNIGFNIE